MSISNPHLDSGAAITVRRGTTRDAGAMARIMAEPGVLANLMQLPYTSEELWAARLAENAVPGRLDLPLVAELGGEVVGSCGLQDRKSVV